jgi:hypothetical protein
MNNLLFILNAVLEIIKFYSSLLLKILVSLLLDLISLLLLLRLGPLMLIYSS